MEKSPVKLRQRKLADGRLSLFLDRSVDGGHEYEFLKLYLVPETDTKSKRENTRTLRKAEDILHERTEALISAKVEAQPKRIICTTGIPNNISIVRRSRKMW